MLNIQLILRSLEGKVMCGMNWYREQLIYAEDDEKRLLELMRMIEERYKISYACPNEWTKVHPDIIKVYKESAILLKAVSDKRS